MRATASIAILLLASCGGENPLENQQPQGPHPPPPPPALAVQSGDFQVGPTGEPLAEPLVVRATDVAGKVLPGVQVAWEVFSGSAELGDAWGYTGPDGTARTSLRPLAPGTIKVLAYTPGTPGVQVTFTAQAGNLPVVIVDFGPLFDCGEPSHFVIPSGPLLVGTRIEFVYAKWVPPGACGAQLRSGALPPGAVPFDSGILGAGERFAVVLDVAGDWEILDVMNGGGITIQVR